MNLIRMTRNVPDVYAAQSRDFQMLLRLLDVVVNNIKFKTDSILDLVNTQDCEDVYLDLLATKVGFFTSTPVEYKYLRKILEAFPYIIKYKGSRKGIELAVKLFLKLNQLKGSDIDGDSDTGDFKVDITNVETIRNEDGEITGYIDKYEILITVQYFKLKTDLLDEILKYILPPGYVVKYQFIADSIKFETDSVLQTNLTSNYAYTPDYFNAMTGAHKDELEKNIIDTDSEFYLHEFNRVGGIQVGDSIDKDTNLVSNVRIVTNSETNNEI